MTIEPWMVFIVVLILCALAFCFGLMATFFWIARDRELVRVRPGQVLVDQAYLDALTKNKGKSSRYEDRVTKEEVAD